MPVTQVYAMGVPILAPSLNLLAELHVGLGLCNHKSAGNVPWRRSQVAAHTARAHVPGVWLCCQYVACGVVRKPHVFIGVWLCCQYKSHVVACGVVRKPHVFIGV